MEKEEKEEKSKKVYWCQCGGENPELAQCIKFGSVPKDTEEICDKCGSKIFEEDVK